MRKTTRFGTVALIALLALMLVSAAAAHELSPQDPKKTAGGQENNQEGGVGIPWTILLVAAGFGAFGGLVYELITLQGNIELPHLSNASELPAGGFSYAQRRLVDLGILARIIIGAGAAIIVPWVLPTEYNINLVAVSVVAGASGMAVFRSLQDRLLAALTQQENDSMKSNLATIEGQLQALQGQATATATGAATTSGSPPATEELVASISEIRGRVQAIVGT